MSNSPQPCSANKNGGFLSTVQRFVSLHSTQYFHQNHSRRIPYQSHSAAPEEEKYQHTSRRVAKSRVQLVCDLVKDICRQVLAIGSDQVNPNRPLPHGEAFCSRCYALPVLFANSSAICTEALSPPPLACARAYGNSRYAHPDRRGP